MSDPRSLLQREMERIPLRPFTIDGFYARRDRKRRNQRIAAVLVAVVIFAAPIALFALGISSDRTQTPAGPRPTPVETGPSVRPGTPPVGLVGLAPKGAKPSTPKRGELILGFMFGHTPGDPGRFRVHLYADGRLISERLGEGQTEASTGYLEQRLTPQGVELVRSEVLSTGLFDRDRSLINAHGLHFGDIQVRNGGRLIRVAWGDIGPKPETVTVASPEDVSALKRLDARLADPASWLPASAWEDRQIRPYVPSRYSVCYEADSSTGLDRLLSLLPAGAEDLLRAKDRTKGEYTSGRASITQYWCSHVTTDEAHTLAKAFEEAGSAGREDVFGLMYNFRPPGRSDPTISVSFAPILPHL
jgi:hypothetical protein